MKRFHFPLHSVWRWRQEQARLEEALLERLRDEAATRHRALAALKARVAAEAWGVLHPNGTDALSLHLLDAYRTHSRKLEARQSREIEQCDQRIAAQRDKVIEARRQARLLEKLYETRLAEWRRSAQKEEEDLAAEFYLAGKGRGRTLDTPK